MFPYKWYLENGYTVEKHGITVMSTFACGGGSTMGYKLAGYDVVAANDIDPQMAKVYQANHKPKHFFECSIKDLLNRDDLPNVDVLDGSPPCSVFSIAGLRDEAWQKDKMFREGQAKQILDDLFFDFIKLVEKMQPKVVIAENVKGMLLGHAKWYTREIVRLFKKIGYNCQVFLLNAATMGVPQRRERVFFIAHKQDKTISLDFNETPILFKDVEDKTDTTENITPLYRKYWEQGKPGEGIGNFKSTKRLHGNKVANTISSSGGIYHHSIPRKINKLETSLIGSWPLDYDFCGVSFRYLIGMSVPPVMMAQVAHLVKGQLL